MIGLDPAKVRQHRRDEIAAGLPLLRGCPNTLAIALVQFLDSLTPAERLEYADQLSSFEETQAANPPKTNDDILDLIRARPLLARHLGPAFNLVSPAAKPIDVRLIPVKLLYAVMRDNGGLDGWAKIARLADDPTARTPSLAHAASFEEVVPVAPRRLRKLLDEAMKQRFAAVPQRIDKELTRYTAPLDGGRLLIDVTFARAGAMRDQFFYVVGGELKGGRKIWNMAYEGAWRTAPTWDYVTETNAERSIAHLGQVIEECLKLV